MGVYLIKKWLLKFMCAYGDEDSKNNEEEQKSNAFTNFYQVFVSFVAKNQFKQEFIKYLP